jgi:hypothetical protein
MLPCLTEQRAKKVQQEMDTLHEQHALKAIKVHLEKNPGACHHSQQGAKGTPRTRTLNSRARAEAAVPAAALEEEMLHDAQLYTYIEPPQPSSPAAAGVSARETFETTSEAETAAEDDVAEVEDGAEASPSMLLPDAWSPCWSVELPVVNMRPCQFQGRRMLRLGSGPLPVRRPGLPMTDGMVAATPQGTSASPRPQGIKRKNAFDWGH